MPLTEAELETVTRPFRSGLVTRFKDTIFIPLPKELWRRTDGCSCDVCKRDKTGGYWDTLAVSAVPPVNQSLGSDRTCTVHYPALHSEADRLAMAYDPKEPSPEEAVVEENRIEG